MKSKRYQGGFKRLAGWLLIVCVGTVAYAQEGSRVLQSIDYELQDDGSVALVFGLSAEAPEPAVFTVERPPRLSIDFPQTGLSVPDRYHEVNLSNVKAYAAAQGDSRTRVVLELGALGDYAVTRQGQQVIVVVQAVGSISSPAATMAEPAAPPASAAAPAIVPPPTLATPEPAPEEPVEVVTTPPPPAESPRVAEATTPAAPADEKPGIRDITFRRAQDGAGRVIISLSHPDIEVEVDQRGGNVVAEFEGIRLPDAQVRRLDVLDFATPVKYVDAERNRKGTTVTIIPVDRAHFQETAYYAGGQFIIELRPLSRAEEEELEERTFKGERISLNFQSIDIRAALRIIADVAGVNLVVSDKVQGEMALRLDDVPWDQALDIILTTNGLGKRLEGNVLLIAPIGELAALEEAEMQARRNKEVIDPLISELIRVNFAKASEMAALLEDTRKSGDGDSNLKEGLLSHRGSVTVDERTNTMLVTDTRDHLREIRRIIEILDVPIEQVLIESRIVVASDEFSKELGARFGVTAVRATPDHFITTTGDANGNNVMVNDYISGGLPVALPPMNNRFNVNLPAAGATGRIGLAILASDYLIDMELSAMQAEGEGEIISTPRVLTANAREATVKQGFEVPYVSASQAGTNVQFKDAVLELKVTPQITPDDRIIMDLNIKKDEPDFSLAIQGNPPLRKREITTQVLVNNGETIVLGGVYEQAIATNISKVPVLGDIPILGHLFKNRLHDDSKNELLIFVTPKILKESLRLD